MEDSQIDAFIEHLFTVEENQTTLTTSQVKKLELIKSKVSEIVKKVEPIAIPVISAAAPAIQAVAEQAVIRFSDYQELNEMIKRRGRKWVVTDKSGKKVLGTHPSKEKALKQLRAIEISKMGR